MAERHPGRILALDVGSKIIGVAVSDELHMTAQGLENVRARPRKGALEVLQHLVRAYNISEMVVGLPVNMDGSIGSSAEAVMDFANRLEETLPVTVHLLDERLTTVQAERILRQAKVSRKKRAGLRDKLSAVIILQTFLDGRIRGD